MTTILAKDRKQDLSTALTQYISVKLSSSMELTFAAILTNL